MFLCLYLLYCLAMGYNDRLEAWAVRAVPVPPSWRGIGVGDTGVGDSATAGESGETAAHQ